MRQETLTVVARVSGAAPFSALRDALVRLAKDVMPGGGARPRVFADPTLGIHFARLVLLEEPSDAAHGSSLIFESNFDTTFTDPVAARRAHLLQLCAALPGSLLGVFEYCADFAATFSPAELAAALERHLVPATAAYQGHTERDLQRIRLEQRVREVLLAFLERAPRVPPRELYQAAREHIRLLGASDPLLAGLDVDAPMPAVPNAGTRTALLAEGYWAWIKNLSLRLLLFTVGQLQHILRWQRSDPQFDQRGRQEAWTAADRQAFVEIAETEDRALQNALTHVVPLKAPNRLSLLRALHGYIDVMAHKYFDDIGQLGGIPSIHFAKWLLLDEGTRLLFLTNYDNSWESYLGDFVDQAAIGLNLAWTCTEGYPTTSMLVFRGASDEERFKAWSRAHQRPTQLFYTAYPELSIAAINNNSWIRDGLHREPGAVELRSWFRRIT